MSITGTDFLGGGGGGGGVRTPRNALHPPEAFATAPKKFCTPSNYTYFDLIFSYLVILIIVLFVETPRKFITAKLSIRKPGSSSVLMVILITKFVKLLILWSQMPPCRPRKQVVLVLMKRNFASLRGTA